MKTSQQQTFQNGKDESTFLQEDSLANLLVMPGSAKARKMTATSGRTCSAALTRSDPLGLLLKMLLESSRWSSRARYLRWQVRQLFSTKVTTFDDTNSARPLPFNESATTLKVTDIPSGRCLFRLAVSEPPTDETGCSSSQGVLLQTPTTIEISESPKSMRARAKKNGYRNGTKFNSLSSQIKYDPRVQRMLTYKDVTEENVKEFLEPMVNRKGLLPTPCTVDYNDPKSTKVTVERIKRHGAKGVIPSDAYILRQAAFFDMLPTPTAIEGVKWTNTWNPNSQMGQSLSAMAGSGMLPTPRVGGQEGYESRAKRKGHECAMSYLETAVDYIYQQTKPDSDAGKTSRLSPLFTEEMMGFPLMWTALPFLSESGEQNPSKPTATPSSHK